MTHFIWLHFLLQNGWAHIAYGNLSNAKVAKKFGYSQQVGTIRKSFMFFKCAALMEPLICKCLHFAAITRKNLPYPAENSWHILAWHRAPHILFSCLRSPNSRCKPGYIHMYVYMYVTVWKTSQLMWMQPKKKKKEKRKKGKSETNGAKKVSGYGLQKKKHVKLSCTCVKVSSPFCCK